MKIDQHFAAKTKTDEDNMVPLINVVFLMLVFFMVAGQIRKADPIPVVPPVSINENRPVSDPNVLILVGADHSIFVDDTLVSLEEVKPYLEQAFEEAIDKDAFWVQIKGDGLLPVEELRPIFGQIRLSGLTKVSLATQLQRGQE